MSYTNVELVRHHLLEQYPVQSTIENQAVVLVGDESVLFYAGEIEQASLVVKSARNRVPTRIITTLEPQTIILTASPLIPGTVTVASDSSRGILYVENEDYVIDYTRAMLTIKPSGRLEAGDPVVIWYLAFELYVNGVDYSIGTSSGTIKRLLSGNIASGEQVYLDYTPRYSGVTEPALEAAVAEADGLVERAVDPSRQFGADPVLQVAATCRALEIVCRTAVTRDLMNAGGSDRTASMWMKLADYYAERSEDLLRSFRPPATDLSHPTLS